MPMKQFQPKTAVSVPPPTAATVPAVHVSQELSPTDQFVMGGFAFDGVTNGDVEVVEQGNFFKFTAEGDTIAGYIQKVGPSAKYPESALDVVVEVTHCSDPEIIAGSEIQFFTSSVLTNQINNASMKIGDWLAATYVGDKISKARGDSYRDFKIAIRRG